MFIKKQNGHREREVDKDHNTRRRADWQEIGREIGEVWRTRWSEPCRCKLCTRKLTKRDHRANYWIFLLSNASRGDPSQLVKHLLSRRAITPFDRRVLAELLEAEFTGFYDVVKPRGRPKKTGARSLVRSVIKLYHEWKEANRRNGISDWGHSDEMKDEACRLILEFEAEVASRFRRKDPPHFDEVRELMDRPLSRRD